MNRNLIPTFRYIDTRRSRSLFSFVMVLLMLLVFPVNISADEKITIEEYNGRPIGVLVGPLMESVADEYFPKSEHLLLKSYADCLTALLTNKVDGFLGDEPSLKMICAEQKEISYLPYRFMTNSYSFAFRKNDPESLALCEELNEFIRRCWEDGTMKQIDEIWFGLDEDRKTVDMSKLRNDKRILRVATTVTDMPFSYIKDGKNVGYDIDLIVRFCLEKGYGLELVDVDFAGRIPEVESGKCDFSTDMNVTPERQEQVLFSEPTSKGGIVLAVRTADLKENKRSDSAVYTSVDELAGKKIGVTTGSIHDRLIAKRLPSAEIMYFTGLADLPVALKARQIDAFVAPESAVIFMHYEDESLVWLDEALTDADLAFAFPKSAEGRKLNEQFDEYLGKLLSDGTVERLKKKWFALEEDAKTIIDYSTLPDINGTLRVATAAQQMPYCYVRGSDVAGLEIEIVTQFCKENGYALEIDKMNFDGVLASLQSGKADLAASCLALTEERKESVDFSRPYTNLNVVLVVTDGQNAKKQAGFFSDIYNSFYKTFIRENRYKLFLEGIGTTMLITLLSIVFGTFLGFVLFMACRNGNAFANRITNLCFFFIQGTPMVVLLMVLYYIIFGSVVISGITVAVIGFTLTFASAVFGLIRMAVGTIDRGQYEAAYALGHSNRQTFYRIILPQAIPHVLPAYKSEIVALIKATAIVGYIAVQDLTKMGDIVRSRTYEAFFPLIAVTVIYFFLESLLGYLVGKISLNIDPRKKKTPDLLKGVKIHD